MLSRLISEAVYLLRETREAFESPHLLFSAGKDSMALLHLCQLAFAPEPIPFSLLHIDTGHNFPEVLKFRDEITRRYRVNLHVHYVAETLARHPEWHDDPRKGRNRWQSATLMEATSERKIDALIGGGRRDEEKARAKERFFSLRGPTGAWRPEAQRPEPWGWVNSFLPPESHMRVFPLSNWTERDVWEFIEEASVPLPEIYFAHRRSVLVKTDGMILANAPCVWREPADKLQELSVRCRTVGDLTCTGLWLSEARTVTEVRNELQLLPKSERGGRRDDQLSVSAMEDRKREGYF